MKINIKRGDLLPAPELTLFRKTPTGNEAVDLATAESISLFMRPNNSTAEEDVIEVDCEPVEGETGVVAPQWEAGDTDTAGNYIAEVKVVWPGPKRETFPNDGYIVVTIVSDIADNA